MTPASAKPYRGVFPVAPTIFDDRGELDLEGQRRCIDFMIDAGSHGICILANFSEQFVLTDAEREQVMDAVLKHVAGRVPVMVTTTHFSSRVCAARSRQAQEAGETLLRSLRPALEDISSGVDAVGALRGKPSGTVRSRPSMRSRQSSCLCCHASWHRIPISGWI